MKTYDIEQAKADISKVADEQREGATRAIERAAKDARNQLEQHAAAISENPSAGELFEKAVHVAVYSLVLPRAAQLFDVGYTFQGFGNIAGLQGDVLIPSGRYRVLSFLLPVTDK